jgi:hypothetical protein
VLQASPVVECSASKAEVVTSRSEVGRRGVEEKCRWREALRAGMQAASGVQIGCCWQLRRRCGGRSRSRGVVGSDIVLVGTAEVDGGVSIAGSCGSAGSELLVSARHALAVTRHMASCMGTRPSQLVDGYIPIPDTIVKIKFVDSHQPPFHQKPHHIDLPRIRRPMQRGVPCKVPLLHISSILHQQFHGVDIAAHSVMERLLKLPDRTHFHAELEDRAHSRDFVADGIHTSVAASVPHHPQN